MPWIAKTCSQSHLTINTSLCRSEPYGAAIWLPGEDEPHAQLNLQHRESHSENVAPPRRELWTEARWNRWHDRRHAAFRSHQHSGLKHPRTANQTGANRAAGRCRVLVCRYPGVGASDACSWTSSDVLTCLCSHIACESNDSSQQHAKDFGQETHGVSSV